MSEWISVEDRLPGYAKKVLAYRKDDEDSPLVGNLYMHPDWGITASSGNDVLQGVTHWMPIPEPPGESTDTHVCDDCWPLADDDVTPEGKCAHCGKPALEL